MKLPVAQRGVTLVELMIVLAVASIVVGIITRVVYVQQRSFMNQLAYSETQQNARASISLLKLYARKAGWGMRSEASAIGEVPLGACYSDVDFTNQQFDCDGIDLDAEDKRTFPNGTDRLRIVALNANPNGGFLQSPRDSPEGSIEAGVKVDPASSNNIDVANYNALGHQLENEALGLIAGPCKEGGISAADLVMLRGSAINDHVYFSYGYTNLRGTGTDLSCPNNAGYAAGFTFSRAVVADFWIDRTTNPYHPILRMRADPRRFLYGDSSYVVAHDIDDLQVQFLLDTACEPLASPGCVLTNTPDHSWDEICDDLNPNTAHADGGCNPAADSQALSWRERLARVVGARLAIVARTRRYDPLFDAFDDSRDTRVGDPLKVQNHSYAGRNDGYRRWIYRATVALRNHEL